MHQTKDRKRSAYTLFAIISTILSLGHFVGTSSLTQCSSSASRLQMRSISSNQSIPRPFPIGTPR